MIIPSPLITLDYDPVKDILSVEWPDIQGSHLAEVKHSLNDIISTIKFYDIKNLLIDSRKTITITHKQEYIQIALDFAKELMNTRLQKVARLESSSKEREAHVREISQIKLTVAFRNFSGKSEALKWLESDS